MNPDPRYQNSPPIPPVQTPYPQQGYTMPHPDADGTGGLIPYKNSNALAAYYIGLFSLLPLAGLIMAPAAVVLGRKGLQYAREHPLSKGQTHAWVGIICGGSGRSSITPRW